MINPLYEPFPESVRADGHDYPIITDFREWFRFAEMIADKELSPRDKIMLLAGWLLEPPERITKELVDAVLDFYKAEVLEPDPPEPDDEDEEEEEQEEAIRPPVFDWKIDAKFVIGDFRRYYGIDILRVKYMHWWEFRCLFAALPDDSQCQKRMAYRSIDLSTIKNSAEQARIARIQKSIAIPFEYDDDMIGAALGGMI